MLRRKEFVVRNPEACFGLLVDCLALNVAQNLTSGCTKHAKTMLGAFFAQLVMQPSKVNLRCNGRYAYLQT